MAEAASVDSSQLLEFIGRADLAVVFMSVHPLHGFNKALCEHFCEERGKTVSFGLVSLRDLLASPNSAVSFLHHSLRTCGAPTKFGILPGYWLFAAGQLLAWTSGLPRASDAPTIVRRSLMGALWTGFTGRTTFLMQALHLGANEAAAQRMADEFRQAVAVEGAAERPRATSWHPPPTADEELARAYQILRVRSSASDQQVKDAWRERRRESHPDHHCRDPEAFERLSKLSAEINHARDTIFLHRTARN